MSQFLQHRIKIGQRGRKRLPASEVCLHMRVYDKYMDFEIVGDKYPGVQLFVTDDKTPRFTQPFSGSITLGEAGIFTDREGYYYYPHEYRDLSDTADPVASEEPITPQRVAA